MPATCSDAICRDAAAPARGNQHLRPVVLRIFAACTSDYADAERVTEEWAEPKYVVLWADKRDSPAIRIRWLDSKREGDRYAQEIRRSKVI